MVLEKLQEIFVDIFEEVDKIDLETVQEDIEEWDSLATINLVVAIEQEFGIKLSMGEIEKSFKDVKSIVELINSKVSVNK